MTHCSLLTKVAIILQLFIIIACLSLIEANNQLPGQATTYFQRPDSNGRPQLMVAIYCGGTNSIDDPYYNQYLDADSRKWRSDRDPSAICTQDKQEILNYCKKVYPKHDIRNIVESSRQYKIDNWCRIGSSSKQRCRTKLFVRPYRCLEGTFQSDALLVPERCLFDHVHNKTVCDNSYLWSRTAGDNCHQKGMKLQSYAMLQPCGLDLFSGVEFVCCPSSSNPSQQQQQQQLQQQQSSAAAAVAAPAIAEKKSLLSSSSSSSSSKVSDGSETHGSSHENEDDDEKNDEVDGGGANNNNNDNDDDNDDDGGEYDQDEDEFDDDSSSISGDKSSQAASSSTTSTTTTTTTTTTERPVDHYLSHFDLAHEHDEFRRAELAVEESYRERIALVMQQWAAHEKRYEEMKKRDPEAAEKSKQEITHQFEKAIKVLEEEGATQRHQLSSMHAERAMAIINRRKKAAMDCLTQALDRMPIKTKQVERCIAKLLRALEKDRAHTLRQYKNLLNINTREALREKKIILDHLVTLNRAANQSIAMLDRSPALVEKLKNKTIALWHRLRGVPLSEPIVKESELKTMEKYEEEVAQRKIEQERQRLVEQEAIQDAPQEAQSSQIKGQPQKQNDQNQASSSVVEAPKQVVISPSSSSAQSELKQIELANINKKLADLTTSTTSRPDLIITNDGHDDVKNEIHYQIESAKFSHLKADSAGLHHELSPSYISAIEQGPIWAHLNIGFSAFLVSACTIIIVIALFGFRYYSAHSSRAYRRQGFAEVGRSCPEEKTVTNLQFNGYENPAYKFFEAEA